MVLLWLYSGFSMSFTLALLWYFTMVLPWFEYEFYRGFSMVLAWACYGFSMVYYGLPWFYHGF